MSRIGKMPISVPENVNVTISGKEITIENSGKKLTHKFPDGINVVNEDGKLIVSRESEEQKIRGFHGLTRTILNNMVIGVNEGFSKKLEIVGRGKRAKLQGKNLTLELGFSHPVDFPLPDGIEAKVEKNIIEISGVDKQKVGETAAEIRAIQPPEPYKGAGIRYEGEHVRKKAGKSAVGGGFTGSGK